MRAFSALWIGGIAGALLMGVFGGCNAHSTWWDPMGVVAKHEPSPIETPAQRIGKLRQLANQADSLTPQEKEYVSSELQRQIQQEPDALVRMQIIKTLARIDTPQATRVLTSGLNDPDPDVRVVCCEAWSQRGGAEAVERLSTTLRTDTENSVRLAAARALGDLENVAAIPALGDALSDPDPAMQFRAVASLEKISGHDFNHDVRAAEQFVQSGNYQRPNETIVERILPFLTR